MTADSVRTYGLIAQNTTAYVEQALACISAGQIVVPLRSATDQHRIELAGVQEVLSAGDGAGWIRPRIELRADDTVAQIPFTSGTEAEPKGVVLTHGNLADVVERLNQVMQVTHEIREYVGVPVYHSFGFGRCRAVAAAGGHLYVPPRGFDPLEISRMLEAGEVNALSAVPSLWRILMQANTMRERARVQLRWAEIGSQPMSVAEKIALRELFPHAKLVQHYGLTEASRSTLLEVHAASDQQLESVGRALGEVAVAIAADRRIRIRGPHVTEQLLTSHGRHDPREMGGWFTTSDLGELRDGFLFFSARADDVINCGGLKLAPDALEDRIRMTLRRAGEFSVCRIADPMRGDGILIAVTPSLNVTDPELLDAVTEAAGTFNVNARGATRILRIEALPRTTTGKVRRKELAERYAQQYPSEAKSHGASFSPAQGCADNTNLRREFCRILGVAKIHDTDNFANLGGDSLRFIQAGMSLHEFLGYLPAGWEHLPFRELEALPPKPDAQVMLEPSVIARAVGITGIVVNHSEVLAGIAKIDGAAFMLMIPMGFSFARFQLQHILASERPWPALGNLPRIMVPTFFVALAHQLKGHVIYPSVLLFYNNFVDHYTDRGFNFWFIEVFVQLQFLLFALCAIPAFRKAVRVSPYRVSLGMYLVGFVISRTAPLVWNTDHLFNLVPWRFIWYLALGWCIFFGREVWKKVLNTALLLLLIAVQPTWNEALWVLFGGTLMIWAPGVRLPRAAAAAVGAVASASLYIYLTHIAVFSAANAIPLPFVNLLKIPLALVLGVLFALLVDRVWSAGKRVALRTRAVCTRSQRAAEG